MPTPDETLHHAMNCGARALAAAKKRFGTGWRLLHPEVRRMAVSEEILNLFYAQHIPDDCLLEFKLGWQHVREAGRRAFEILDAE